MVLRFFAEFIDAVGKVASGLKAIANLPKAECEMMRQTQDEAYRLIDTKLNLVIIRLGDILLQLSDKGIVDEIIRPDNHNGCMQVKREFRLCRSLRVALRGTESVTTRLAGTVVAKDWDALRQQMQAILATESEVALFIGQQFEQIGNEARNAAQGNKRTPRIRGALTAFRASLVAERQRLIKQELTLYDDIV